MKTIAAIICSVIIGVSGACCSQATDTNNQHDETMKNACRELPKLTPKDKARFCSKIKIDESDRCWEWSGAPNRFGYRLMKIGGRDGVNFFSHRISYSLFVGRIPQGLCVCHKCDNPACVNPNHLWLGTKTENTADRHAKGRSRGPVGMANIAVRCPWRMARGEKNGVSKLTTSGVIKIRKLRKSGMPLRVIAKKFNVCHKTVMNIEKGRCWRHV